MMVAGVIFCLLGSLFIAVGAVTLWRFADTLSRLHALTKADNVGLGFIAAGCGLVSGDPWFALKAGLLWFTMLVVSSLAGMLLASHIVTEQGAAEQRCCDEEAAE